MPKKKKQLETQGTEKPKEKRNNLVIYLLIFFLIYFLATSFTIFTLLYDKEHYDDLLAMDSRRNETIIDLCKIIEELDPEGEYADDVQWIVNRLWGGTPPQ